MKEIWLSSCKSTIEFLVECLLLSFWKIILFSLNRRVEPCWSFLVFLPFFLEHCFYFLSVFCLNSVLLFFFFFFCFLKKFYFILKLYIIVLVLPNIKMNPPQVYMCFPSWTLLPPPSPYHPTGSSQCTSPKHPVSCIEPGLATLFLHDILHV